MSGRISTRITILIGFFGAVAAVLVAVMVPLLIEDLIRRNALSDAKINIEQIKILRGYYTEYVIAPIEVSSSIAPHYAHKANDSLIPLPATMVHDLSNLFSKEGRSLDLYSNFPFPNRSERKLDGFQLEAWETLSRDAELVFSQTQEINGREVMRVAIADAMDAEACVACHNSHPESPKRDWRIGDVRGVLEMQLDLTDSLDLARQFGLIMAAILAATAAIGSIGLSLFMRKSLLIPMEAISNAAQSCADGNTSISVLGVERSDEIGMLARSLGVRVSHGSDVCGLVR